jgi:hypothetical protein
MALCLELVLPKHILLEPEPLAQLALGAQIPLAA